jgi:hypothetical protein
MMQVEPTSNSNPLAAIILILAIFGAIADRHYKKAGGDRPDKSEKRGLAIALIAAVGVVLILIIFDNAREAGLWTGRLAVLVFAVWEAWRWRIRRDNPIYPTDEE